MSEGARPFPVTSPALPEAPEARLRARLPGLAIHTVVPLGEGAFSRAFLVNGSLVLREAKHRAAALALEREACLMPRLAHRLPVAVPVPRWIPPAPPHQPALGLHQVVSGSALTRARWDGFPGGERARMARSLGAFLGTLHATDLETVEGCGLETVDHIGQVGDLRTRLRGTPATDIPGALRERTDRALAGAGRPAGVAGDRVVLLHGDISPEHVLVEDGEAVVTGVIDWGDVHLGDPAFDFIYLYEDWGPDFLDLALAGYPTGREAGFRTHILLHFLVEHLRWTLDALEEGRTADLPEGLQGLARVVDDLERAMGR
jgi:aminoglycoside 2''-phosphotransferase